ncbi:hypothetical protein SUGI_0891040 [Cryptomeria japonica]|nr:hypothetical protein SUGI_0891040 [Cryptomeria japonica]
MYWIFLTIQLTLIFIAEAQNVHFNFPSSGDDDDIQLLEDAHLSESGQGIELTKSRLHDDFNWSMGWAIYKRPVEIWCKSSGALASFQSYFQFKLYRGTQTKMDYYADGLTFFMASSSQQPQNGSGMWLGLFNSTTNGKSSTQKVAIEFDTFKNAIIDEYYGVNANDPDDNHVGIDINNTNPAKTVSLSQRLNSGETWEVWIDYDERLSIIISLTVGFVAMVAVILLVRAAIRNFNKKTVISDRDLNIPDPNSLKSDGVLERVDERENPNRSPRVYSMLANIHLLLLLK